jgi:hypothetical protein
VGCGWAANHCCQMRGCLKAVALQGGLTSRCTPFAKALHVPLPHRPCCRPAAAVAERAAAGPRCRPRRPGGADAAGHQAHAGGAGPLHRSVDVLVVV